MIEFYLVALASVGASSAYVIYALTMWAREMLQVLREINYKLRCILLYCDTPPPELKRD
jgi:hypothetical protein